MKTLPGYWPRHWLVPAQFRPQLLAALEQAVTEERVQALRPRRDDGGEVDDEGQGERPAPYILDGDEAIIPVRGFLLSDATPEWVARWLEWPTYRSVVKAARAAVADERVARWALDADCPGGAAVGCFEAGRALLDLGKVKPSRTYARGYCTSAMYWLAAATARIVASPDAMLGSIGTATQIVDLSEYWKREGIRVIDMAGQQSPRKRPDISQPDGLREVQQQLDDLTENFVQWVAARRRVPREYVIEKMGGGGCMVATRAIGVRLCDEVLELVPGKGQPLPAPTKAAPAPTPAAATDTPPSASTKTAGAAGRKNAGPLKRAAAPGGSMSFEPQCRAVMSAAESALSVLDAENADHADCRTACEGVVSAGQAALDAGEEGLTPGSDQGTALADACDTCAEACGRMTDIPECVACAASCEACSAAARGEGDSGGAAATNSAGGAMKTKREEQLASENARLQTELRAANAAARAQKGLTERIAKLEGKDLDAEIARELDHQEARGAIDPATREDWAADMRAQGVGPVKKAMDRIPDNAFRPTKLRGSADMPKATPEDQKRLEEIKAIQETRKCGRLEAHKIWAQSQDGGDR